jgi:hypothetical protein
VIQTTCPLFQSAHEFRLWEASCELRACFDEVTTLIGRKDQLSSLLLGNLIEKTKFPQVPIDQASGVSVVHCNKIVNLCERFLHSTTCFDCHDSEVSPREDTRPSTRRVGGDVIDLTESGDESVDPPREMRDMRSGPLKPFSVTTRLLRPYMDLCSEQFNLGVKNKTKVTSDCHPVLSLLSIMTLGTAMCFRSYLSQVQEIETTPDAPPRPPFMSELNAGTAHPLRGN